MKKFIISLIFFLLTCSSTSAWEDTTERYSTGVFTEEWYHNGGSLVTYPEDTTSHALKLTLPQTTATKTGTLETVDYIDTSYFSFTVKNATYNCNTSNGTPIAGGTANIQLLITGSGVSITTTLFSLSSIPGSYTLTNTTYEVLESGGRLVLYSNGVYTADIGAAPTVDCKYTIKSTITGNATRYVSGYCIQDDFSNEGSTIGISEAYSELTTYIPFSYRVQAFHSYPSSTYKISLYQLSGDTSGKIQDYTITSQAGNINFNRSSTMGLDFGLYMLELTRDDDILRDTYFYYYQSANPQGLPEILFLGESDVLTDIRDENNNGGETSSSVYLYPDVQADGTYNFTYEVLETPYAIKTELTTVYSNTAINSATINYSGLSNQNYKISVDGAEVGSTNGADTYSYTFTDWSTETNHIISFAPDYTLAGVWGEVKNSETQEGIKSATVSVSGENFSKTLYTDDNGLFYLTKGMEAGKTYTISVSKTGYSTPPSQTAITVEGSTTRQDFYMDKLSTTGSGLYYAPHDVGFTVLEYWYSGAGLTGVNYAIYNGTESIKTGTTDSKGMFTGSDMTGGTNYTIILTHNGTTYTEYVEPSLTEYTFVLNKEGILHQYANSWLTLSYTENTNNVTIAYTSNKTLAGASLTAIAGNGTTVYSQTLNTTTGTFTFETGGEGDYTLNFHIQATDGSTASQSWGLSYPDKIPLFPDSYPAWLKNVLFSGIVMVFLLAFGKSKNDIACGAVAILTSMGYMFEWFTGSFYFVVLVWIIALGAVFLHYKRTGGIG